MILCLTAAEKKRAEERVGCVPPEEPLPQAVFHCLLAQTTGQRGSEQQGLVNLPLPGLHMNKARRAGSKTIILLLSKEL